jgi:hypothetical protein
MSSKSFLAGALQDKRVGYESSVVGGITVDGFYRTGVKKYNLEKEYYIQDAIDAFNTYSKYGSNKVSDSKLVTEHLTYFLHALDIVSGHEGGFDSYNSYGNSGLAIGMIQFALTSGYIKNILNEMKDGLGTKVVNSYSGTKNYIKDIDLSARVNKSLCSEILDTTSLPNSIQIQLKYVIQKYYDISYSLFLSLVKPKIKIEKSDNLFVYANSFMFDRIVNNGNLGPINKENLALIPKDVFTEGTFIYKMSAGGKVKLENAARDAYWNGVNPAGPFGKNFIEGSLPS